MQFSSDGGRFESCTFDKATIQSASFGAGRRMSEYIGCTFDGAKLRMGPGGYARFVDCSFEKTSIDHWFCFAVELVNCTFSGRLRKVIFNGQLRPDDAEICGRTTNQFEGNDFSRATLHDVGFRTGIDLTKQQLPDGDGYIFLSDAVHDLRNARIAYNAWNDVDHKKRVGGVLKVLEEDAAGGQRQLHVRVADYPRANRAAIRALFDAASGSD